LLSHQLTDGASGLEWDRALSDRRPRRLYEPVFDQRGELVSSVVIDRAEPGDRSTSIGHDHFNTCPNLIEVPAQIVLKVTNSDLDAG
jgi:hypothetical protein